MSLERARKLLNWTQSRLAREAHTNISNIRDLESGKNSRPAFALVMDVTNALRRGGLSGLAPEDIFDTTKPDQVAS
jgi:transcriptional regulator with XRE-family HTH domain